MRRSLAAALCAAALLGVLAAWLPVASWREAWLGLQLRWAAPLSAPVGVVVIDIDETALQQLHAEFGPWPLSRDAYALALEALREAGVRGVALDLLLADERPGDAALAQLLQRPGAPIALAVAAQAAAPAQQPAPTAWPWAQFTRPAASVGAASAQLGVISQPLQADGQLRQWWLWHEDARGERLPALPLALLQALGETPRGRTAALPPQLAPLLARVPAEQVSLPALLVAAREGGPLPAGLRQSLRGRVVFLGASAALGDRVMTPVGQISGTQALAQAYAALRDGRWLSPAGLTWQAGLWMLALLPGLRSVRRARTAPGRVARDSLLALLLLALVGLWLAPWAQIWVDPSAALLTLAAFTLLHAGLHLHQAQQRARQAQLQQAAAEQANAAKSAFVDQLSQQLRTPLATLLGAAEALRGSAGRPVQLIQQAGLQLQQQLDTLLDFGRLEQGRLRLQPEPTALQPLLQQTLALAQSRVLGRGVQCELVLDAALPAWVLADGARLQQVLLGLLEGALTHTPQGRVLLRVAVGPAGLQFSVSDTGIGISASTLSRLLQAPSAEPAGQAQDLQLALAQRLVQAMGGAIEAQSAPGAGSRFAFTLALPPCEAPAAVPHQGLASGLTVLLAEDDELLAEVLTAQLDTLGLHVHRARNGHVALAMLQRAEFDLLLAERQLAGLDGLRLAEELRALEARQGLPRTPMLLLSGSADALQQATAQAAGVDLSLLKPVPAERLHQALAAHAPAAPRQRRSAPATGAAAEADPGGERHAAHARVFLGHWGAHWQAAALHPESTAALLHDLRDCAHRLQNTALQTAAEAALAQLQASAPPSALAATALQRAVEDALWRLRD